MESLGTFLKRGREEAGLTLEDLATKTCIRRESLEALEKEDLESLPPDAFVRGFVKLVCREISVPAREGLLRYETLRESLAPQDEIAWSEDRAVKTTGRLERALEDPERVVRRAQRLVRVGIVVASVALGVLLVWGGATLVQRMRPASPGEADVAASVPDDAAPLEPTSTPPAENPAGADQAVERGVEEAGGNVVGAVGGGAPEAGEALPRKPVELPVPLEEVQLANTGPPVLVPERILVTVRPAGSGSAKDTDTEVATATRSRDKSPPSRDATQRPPEENTPPDSPPPTPEETRAETAQRPAARSSARPQPLPPPGPGERLQLEVQALRPVAVTVLLDGIGYPRKAELEAGEWKLWKADSLFTLSASDGGALRIWLAGEDLGVPGPEARPLERLVLRGR